MTSDIFQRARELRAHPMNRDMTQAEALSLLSRRRKARRTYGRVRVGSFSAILAEPTRYAWQDRAGGDL